MPCATTLRVVPSTTSDAVFGHNRSERSEWRSAPANPHAPYGLRRRGTISGVVAPPRYARYRVVAPPWICRAPAAGGVGPAPVTRKE